MSESKTPPASDQPDPDIKQSAGSDKQPVQRVIVQQQSNNNAVVGLILSLTFFPLGLLFSILGLRDAKKRNGEGQGTAIAGIVISGFGFLLSLLILVLVINAVDEAKLTQRNNVRSTDVSQIATAVKEYIATRNALPSSWDQLKNIIGSNNLGHYNDASINPAASWVANIPDQAGTFPLIGVSACSDPSETSQSTCAGLWDHDGDSNNPDIARVWTASITATHATTGSGFIGTPSNDSADDMVIILRQAGCANTSTVEAGGFREMAIVYRLEGQSQISCLEV